MAITVVGVTPNLYNSSSDLTGTAIRTGVTAGNALILMFTADGGVPTVANILMSGETVEVAGTPGSGATTCCGTQGLGIVYVKDVQAGGSKSFTGDLGTNRIFKAAIIEVTGQDKTNFLNVGGTVATGTGTALWAKTLSATVANCLAVGVGIGNTTSQTPDTGYTTVAMTTEAGGEYNADIGAGTGSKTVQMTDSGSGNWVFMAALFAPAGAGAPANWGRMLSGELNRLVRPIYD